MSISDYKVVEGRTVDELNTAVAEAISDGYSPVGQVVSHVMPFGTVLVQTMVKGITENFSAVGATIAGYGDVVTHDAADFATAAQGAKADSALQDGSAFATAAQGAKADAAAVASTTTTALAAKAPVNAPVFTGGAVLATGAAHTVDDVIAALQVRGIVKQS